MNRGQYQSEIKEEERSAIENVRDEEAEIINKSFAKADNKVLIKLPSKFCKEIKKYLQSGKIATFYEMKLPKRFNYIDGINVGGGTFYPVVMFPDKFNDSLMCASFLKDWKLQIKLEDGEVLKTTPEKLQKYISEGYQKYKEAEANGTLDNAKETEANKQVDLGKKKNMQKDLGEEI